MTLKRLTDLLMIIHLIHLWNKYGIKHFPSVDIGCCLWYQSTSVTGNMWLPLHDQVECSTFPVPL